MPHLFAVLARSLLLLLPVVGCQGAAAPSDIHPWSTLPERTARIRAVETGLVPLDTSKSGAPATLWSIQDRMAHYRVPGVSVAVIEGGWIDWARGYGLREAGGTARVDTATLFQSASISKPVTTVGVLRLVDQGRLALDEDVNARLQSWRVPASDHTREHKVTLRRILTHSAGLTASGFAGYVPGEPVPTLLQVLDSIPPANSEAVRVSFVPGSAQRYSGGGFTVAQLLVTEAAGKPFETALHQLVFAPAGMVHSTFAQPLPERLASRAATGHQSDGSALLGRWRIHPEQAAAGLWSTPSDLARLAIALQRAAAGEGSDLISQGLAKQMLAPQLGPSGLGFVVLGEGERRIFRHAGSNQGFRARMLAFVEGGQGAVVMTNGDGGMELAGEILHSIARTYRWPSTP